MWSRLRANYPLRWELLGVALLVWWLAWLAVRYGGLPDRVPGHFSFGGTPTSWSGKGILWLPPMIGLLIYLGDTLLTLWFAVEPDFRRLINLPGKERLSLEGAEKARREVIRFMLAMKLITVGLLFDLTYNSVEVALGRRAGLGQEFWGFLAALLGSIAFFMWRLWRLARGG